MVRKRLHGARRTLDARPDELDERDRPFDHGSRHVPPTRALADYLKASAPVLDQGTGGGSVGFALATVANYLVRSNRPPREADPVSPWMLQALGVRYDPWCGHDDAGVEPRAALKGWYAHGVCRDALWSGPLQDSEPTLTRSRAEDASARPLAGYARVDARSLSDVQAAISQSGILLASAWLHEGWFQPRSDGTIVPASERIGCHAFAMVAYDVDGFWIQNAWGRDWGRQGFGYLTYDDWLLHGADVWFAQLGAPVRLPLVVHHRRCARLSDCPALYSELRAHLVCIDDDGRLRGAGPYGNSKGDVEAIFRNDFARVTATWPHKRILVCATDGLADESAALEKVRASLPAYLVEQVYPIALVWRRSLGAHLQALARLAREAGALTSRPHDDAGDDLIERLVRDAGRRLWEDVKRGAAEASAGAAGAMRLLAGHLAHSVASHSGVELHAWAEGAGALLLAPFIPLLAGPDGFGIQLRSCGLVAPACSRAMFQEAYARAAAGGAIGHLTLLQLGAAAAPVKWIDGYGRSFLQLVANALEVDPRIPGVQPGSPLIGLEGAVPLDDRLQSLLARRLMTIEPMPQPTNCGRDVDAVLAHLPRSPPDRALLGIAEPPRRYGRRRQAP